MRGARPAAPLRPKAPRSLTGARRAKDTAARLFPGLPAAGDRPAAAFLGAPPACRAGPAPNVPAPAGALPDRLFHGPVRFRLHGASVRAGAAAGEAEPKVCASVAAADPAVPEPAAGRPALPEPLYRARGAADAPPASGPACEAGCDGGFDPFAWLGRLLGADAQDEGGDRAEAPSVSDTGRPAATAAQPPAPALPAGPRSADEAPGTGGMVAASDSAPAAAASVLPDARGAETAALPAHAEPAGADLRTGEVVARIWIAPFVDADGVYREASHVRAVLEPAGWAKNDRASASICAAIGTSQGIFSDYAAAKHGCGADGRRNSTLASASGAMADQVPVNVNYAWKAVRASSFLAGDTQLAEFAMAVSGTVIVTAPTSDGDASGPRVRILEPLALDRRVTEILMEGGGALPVYRCDTTDRCLNPTLGTVTIPAGRGFRERVAGLLRDLVDAVRTDTAPPAPALGLVNLTTLPVYRVANTAAAYRGAVVDQEMDALAEAVALDVLQVWISDLHRTVEERAGTLDIADGEQLRRWREGLRVNRTALARHRNEGLARFNTALAVVEKLRLIETELAGALSADLRAALAFARGGAGAGSR